MVINNNIINAKIKINLMICSPVADKTMSDNRLLITIYP